MQNNNDDKSLTTTLSFKSWRERAKLSREMYGLSERTLADIGIRRDQIPAIIEKAYPRLHVLGFLKVLLAKWADALKNRETAMKLSSFDDRMLADIGLARSDISAIANGNYPAHQTPAYTFMDIGFASSANAAAVNDDHKRAA